MAMWSGIRSRAGQAWALAGLAALLTACAVFAPLLERALEQGLLVARLAQEPVGSRGLTLSSSDTATRAVPSSAPAPDDPTPANLARQVPPAFHRVAGTGVGSIWILVKVDGAPVRVVARDGVCGHVRITAGRCPSARNEVAVSPADSRLHRWGVGSRLVVAESTSDLAPRGVRKFFTVVGLYQQLPSPAYWLGEQLDGRSGIRAGFGEPVGTDDWVTDAATMAGGRVDPDNKATLALAGTPAGGTANTGIGWMRRTATLQVPLRPGALTIDSMGPVNEAVSRVLGPNPDQFATVSYASGLPGVVADVRSGQAQARLIVPLLLGQLGLIALVVLWLLLRAATGQRRPEVALARLRGQSARSAWAMVTAELGVVLLAGALVGVAAAVGLQRVVLRFLLPAGVPMEFPRIGWVAGAGAAAVCGGCLGLATRQVAREPVSALLRGVPPRRAGWAVGVADAMLVTVAAAALVTLLSDRGTSALAIAAPPLLALALSLLLTHAVAVLAPPAGRWLLRRGRAGAALLMLRLSRRSWVRQLTAVVAVTAALVVFAADVYVVAARNRHAEAVLEVGAPMVASVDLPNLDAVQAALARVDPGGRVFTPVYQVAPPSGGSTVLMVHPGQFRRIASWSGAAAADPAWQRLSTPLVSPLPISGGSVTVTVTAPGPQFVTLGIVLADGQDLTHSIDLGEVTSGAHRHTAAAPCRGGCRVLALTVTPTDKSNTTQASFTLTGLRAGGGPAAPLGRAGQWATPAVRQPGDTITLTRGADDASAVVAVNNVNGDTQQLTHRDVADLAPALVGGAPPTSGNLPQGHPAGVFTASGIDGVDRAYRQVGSLPDVPGGSSSTVVTDLDTLQRDGRSLTALPGQVQVWSARDDLATLNRLRAALRSHGLAVGGVQRVATVQKQLAQSASGWGLQLGLLAALAGLAVAVLAIGVQASTTWRAQAQENAALRLTGIPATVLTRLAVLEQVAVVGVAVLLGAGCGVLGAHLTLPTVPIFTTPPPVLVPDLSTPWGGVAAAAVGVLAALAAACAAAARWVGRRSTLNRLQDNG